MSQVMLADHAQITREHLSELENGKKEIGARILGRIVSALGLSLKSFFDDRSFERN
jgi:transcriptional regulator with XRE-family HTH domain